MKGTKNRILIEALKQFSEVGYDAASVDSIAEGIGIKGPSLYRHFKSKQDLFDSLVKSLMDHFSQGSTTFLPLDENGEPDLHELTRMTLDEFADMVHDRFVNLLHDEYFSRARKVMTIEQFRRPEMSALLTEYAYSDVFEGHVKVMRKLTEMEILINEDPVIMAAQYCMPISGWLDLCDRDPSMETEVLDMLDRHIRMFHRIYRKKAA